MKGHRILHSMLSVTAGAVLAGGISFGAASVAQAALMIEVSDGVNPNQVFSDNDLSDFDARPGVLVIGTNIGNFQLVFSIAQTKPFVGTDISPVIDITFAATSFTNGGELTIKVTEIDFLLAPTSGNCRIGGDTSGTVDYSCYYDDGNAPFAQTSLIADLGPLTGAFAATQYGKVDAAGPYSLTDVLKITHGPGSIRNPQITTGNANIRVPEPKTLALFGFGLLGIGLLMRRRRPSAYVRAG